MAEINGRPTSPTAPLVLLKDAKTGEGAAGPVGGGTNAKRSPTFDSLRGMGVVLVMLYHLRLGVPNAWACIGLFFAGSGFVMTVMAIEVVAKKGAFDAPLFWKRRVLRLFPALQVKTHSNYPTQAQKHREPRTRNHLHRFPSPRARWPRCADCRALKL